MPIEDGLRHGWGWNKLDPDHAAEQLRGYGFVPLAPYPGAGRAWPARCQECAAVVSPKLNNLRSGQGGCRPCGKRRAAAARRAHKGATAVEVMRAAGYEPLTDYPGAKRPWPARCLSCGAESAPHLSTVQNGSRCRVCAPQARGAAHVAAGASDAVQVMVEAGWQPSGPYPGASEPWPATHECGWSGTPTLQLVRGSEARGRGCQRCSGVERVSAEAAEVELRAAGFVPLAPYPGRTNRAWASRCTRCGQESRTCLSSLRFGKGCAACGIGKARDTKLSAAAPQAVADMRAAGLEPQTDYPGGNRPWPATCQGCGGRVSPRLHNIRQGQGGCMTCAENSGGISPDDPALIYLMWQPARFSTKVGIARAGSNRIHQHELRGWQRIAVWSGITGAHAYAVERATLVLWRNLGYPQHLTADDMPQAGATETAAFTPDMVAFTVRMVTAGLLARGAPVDMAEGPMFPAWAFSGSPA